MSFQSKKMRMRGEWEELHFYYHLLNKMDTIPIIIIYKYDTMTSQISLGIVIFS